MGKRRVMVCMYLLVFFFHLVCLFVSGYLYICIFQTLQLQSLHFYNQGSPEFCCLFPLA